MTPSYPTVDLDYCSNYQSYSGMRRPNCERCQYKNGCPLSITYPDCDKIMKTFVLLMKDIEALKHEVYELRYGKKWLRPFENVDNSNTELFD